MARVKLLRAVWIVVVGLMLAANGCAEEEDPDNANLDPNPIPEVSKQAAGDVIPSVGAKAAAKTPRPPRPVRPLERPADLDLDVAIAWQTPFGPAGVAIPRYEDSDQTQLTAEPNSAGWFNRLTGVVFPPDRNEIVFVGAVEEGLPFLDPADLLDAFVVGFRSLSAGSSPGVTIDPLPEQVQRGLREDDLMLVRYFGEAQGTEFGDVAFEVDRQMKCQSFGKDNITKEPFLCTVPGYRSELDFPPSPTKQKQTWHRFWIEPEWSDVQQSREGRTFLVETKMGVQTRHMVPKNGKLEDSKQKASPSAQAFAQHLTDHYAEYAKERPAFGKLAAFAAVTSVADAVRSPVEKGSKAKSDSDAQRARPALDLEWLLTEHQVKQVTTANSTPATIVSKVETIETRTGTETHTQRLEGGVTIAPKNRYRIDAQAADAMERAVLAGRPLESGRRVWNLAANGADFRAVAVSRPSVLRYWQQDAPIGSFGFVRDYTPGSASSGLGAGWTFRWPRIKKSAKMVKYTGLGEMAQWVAVEDIPGLVGPVVLDRAGMIQLPDAKGELREAPSYFDAAGVHRLACFNNVWVFLKGDVRFRSVNDGPFQPAPKSGERYVEFSPDERHDVSQDITEDSAVTYKHVDGRLVDINDVAGRSIHLLYDDAARCRGLEMDDGAKFTYRYDAQGRLAAIVDNQGRRLIYQYSESDGRLVGIGADEITTSTGEIPISTRLLVRRVLSVPKLRQQAAELASDELGFVVLDYSNDSDSGFEVSLTSNSRIFQSEIDTLTQRIERKSDDAEEAIGVLKAQFEAVAANRNVVIDATAAPKTAVALRRVLTELFPNTHFSTSTDSPRASENVRRLAELESAEAPIGAAEVIVHYDGLKGDVPAKLRELESRNPVPSESGVVIFTGHNCDSFWKAVLTPENQARFQGKQLLLLTCNSTDKLTKIEGVLENCGAMNVISFSQPIDQSFLQPIISRVQQLLNEPNQSIQSLGLQRILQRAIDGIPQAVRDKAINLPNSVTGDDLEKLSPHIDKLKLQDDQVNRKRSTISRTTG